MYLLCFQSIWMSWGSIAPHTPCGRGQRRSWRNHWRAWPAVWNGAVRKQKSRSTICLRSWSLPFMSTSSVLRHWRLAQTLVKSEIHLKTGARRLMSSFIKTCSIGHAQHMNICVYIYIYMIVLLFHHVQKICVFSNKTIILFSFSKNLLLV